MGNFRIKYKELQSKQTEELKELRSNRGEFYGFIINFIQNISNRINVIDVFKENKEYKSNTIEYRTAIGQYIASLATCWETLFRDVLITIVQIDSSIYEKVKLNIEKNNITITDIESKDITIGEFLSKQYNLQNIDSIGKVLNFLFDEKYDTVFEYLSKALKEKIYFTSPSYIMLLVEEQSSMIQEIEKIIRKAFEIRHKVIHDANFYIDFDSTEMKKMEECLIMFPQFLMIWLTHKYHQKGLVFDFKKSHMRMTSLPTKDEGWYIIGTKEMRKKDWITVD